MADGRITAVEWRSEIERVMSRTSDEGQTAREIAVAIGLSERTTGMRLRALFEAGRLGVGQRAIITKNGRHSFAPVYWVKPSNNGNK